MELATTRMELARLESIVERSARWRIPANLAALIWDVALSEGVDPDLAYALVAVESGFNPAALSTAGAIGLAQVMPQSARAMGCPTDTLWDPEANLRCGLRILQRYLADSGGDLRAALLRYNGCVTLYRCGSYPERVLALRDLRNGE
jgi:soluble lytic murein transglycosylase-like protein